MRRRWYTVLLVAFFVICLLHVRPVSSNGDDFSETPPYIDKIVYKVIPSWEQRALAIQGGVIDMDLSLHDPRQFEFPLGLGPDISVDHFLRNGYVQITFNCRNYPLNISGFRRAFAHAFDKTRVVDELGAYAEEHDSMIPYVNDFCVEDELEWHWYEDETDVANALLDSLNFTIDPLTGFRVAPNGEPFGIDLMTLELNYNEEVALIAKETFEALHVPVTLNDPCCYTLPKVFIHERDFNDYDISWLATEYGSENVNDTLANLSGFSNSTFDIWGEQLLNSRSYEAVFHAASEMQKILHQEVPSIVAYQNLYAQVYRTDKFKDHIEDLDRYMTGYWTMMNIIRLDDTRGGILAVGVDKELDSFNIFAAESNVSKTIFDMCYLRLFTRTPDLQATPQLAKEMTVETHDDNPSIQEGYTRFTIEMSNKSYWTDDTSYRTDDIHVTAYDVAFTFNYIIGSGEFGNPMAEDLTDLVTVYAPNPFRVVLEFWTESYWSFEKFAYKYILPKHRLANTSLEDWDEWSLTTGTWDVYPHNVESLCNGPFVLTDADPNEFYELSTNIDWLRNYYNYLPPIVDVYLSSADDFSTFLPYFQLRWDVDFLPEPHYDSYLPSGFDYTILLDGEHYVSRRYRTYSTPGAPGAQPISVSVNDAYLTGGSHNFTIIVETLYHGLEIDTVIVTVQVSMYQMTPILGVMIPFLFTGMLIIGGQIVDPKKAKNTK